MKISSTTSVFGLAIGLIFIAYGTAYAEQTAEATELVQPIVDSETTPDSVVIEGDQLQIHIDHKFKSIGNALLHQEKQDIYGDTIEYDMQNKELHAIGNVRVISSGGSVTGPELRMQLEDKTGYIDNAKFKMNQPLLPSSAKNQNAAIDPNANLVGATQQLSNDTADQTLSAAKQSTGSRGDAKTILFEGDDKKRFKHSRYTTCEVDSDDWYIKSSDLVIDNYTKTATARNAVVEFQGVPILYTPWIDFSFLNQRKSGLLAPTVGTTSKSGFEILTPYYFNIAPNIDSTVATRYLSKRGLQYQGELRYITETYSGIDNIEYLDNDSTTGKTRYYAKIKHTQDFGNGWSASLSLEKVSDNQYFSDMSTRITATSIVNLPQQGSLSYGDGVWGFNALVQKYQTLDGVSYPYERLPQLTLTRNEDYGMLNTNVYTQWVSFDRNNSAPLTTATPSGSTISTQVTGNRFTAYPSISLPIEQPYGYITPKLGLHYSSYSLNNTAYSVANASGIPTSSGNYESTSQAIPTFTLDSGLFFDRNVKVVNNSYTQTLEPRLFYVYIPYKDQSMLPVFDTSDSDLNMGSLFRENEFIGNDRLNNANQLSMAVTTRMIDNTTGQQRLAATLGQRFYFVDQRVFIPGAAVRSGNSSDIVAALTAKLLSKWNVDAAWQFDTDTGQVQKSDIGTRYSPEPGKTLNLSYRYTQDFLEQINVSAQWPISPNWYSLARYNYSIMEKKPIEALAGIEYDAGCWVARGVFQQVSTATANANYAIFIQLELGGLTSIGSDPLSLLNRSIPGYTNSSLIPNSVQQPTY